MKLANLILEYLYECKGDFIALEQLLKATDAGHRRVEEALTELDRRGHRFERSPAQGIRLLRPTVMDAHLIERDLSVKHIGQHVICFDEVDSTNDVAFASAQQAAGQALVVTAEYQRAGRGRLGRKWLSPPGSAVLASVLLHRQACELPHEALTLAAGLAVAEGVAQAAGVEPTLDWPNDIVIDGAKLAGVLVEVRATDDIRQVVIGFGINVLATPPREMLTSASSFEPPDKPVKQVSRSATCLSEAVGGGLSLERIEILRAVLVRMDRWVAVLQSDGADELHEKWCRRCGMINRRLSVMSAGQHFAGRVVDVSPAEGLVLLADDGQRLYLPAATSTILSRLDR